MSINDTPNVLVNNRDLNPVQSINKSAFSFWPVSNNKCSTMISLSDEKNYAIANVIIFENNEIN